MGLSASQARVFLLTSRNDSLELQAQLIENERLLLSQEQERISNEYSEATSNEIWTCSVYDTSKTQNGGKGTSQKNMSLKTLAESYANSKSPIYVKYGDTYYGIEASYSDNGQWSYKFYTATQGSDGSFTSTPLEGADIGSIANSSSAWSELLQEGYGSIMQIQARFNNLEILTPVPDEYSNDSIENVLQVGNIGYQRKSVSSLATTSSRYYTEDDAAAEAKYNAAMQKVNAIDKKLENKLNQLETQKKATESELESAKKLIQTNEDRTFKYFS